VPLPFDILRRRVRNEIDLCRERLKAHSLEVVGDPEGMPLTLKVTLRGVPGPDLVDGRLVHRIDHVLVMEISEEYPYQKPLVIWATPIFHPNIMTPEDGGFVCTKLLENWGFDSNLLLFIKGIEALLSNPNPLSPYGTDSCTRAAELFNREPYVPPSGSPPPTRNRPKVVGGHQDG
jgi:ubiquitin-protein ligase